MPAVPKRGLLLTSTPMRIASVGTLISSGLVFGYLGGRGASAYAAVAPTCSAIPGVGAISTDDSFNAAVAAVNHGECNVIDIAAGFTFHTAPTPITYAYDDSLTILGLDADDSVLNGNSGEGLAMEVPSGLTLSVSTLALTAFNDTVGTSQSTLSLRATGGDVDVHLSDVTFTHNYSGGSGGAVYVWTSYHSSAVRIDGDSYFGYNTSAISGGAVFVSGTGTVNVDNTTFSDNTSLWPNGFVPHGDAGGGAIQASAVTVTDSHFLRNQSLTQGGAISGGNITTYGGLFQDDSAPVGGAIQGAYVSISDGTHFTSNEASNKGGAIDGGVSVEVHDSFFTDNQAQNGGAIYTNAGAIQTYGTVFMGNDALSGDGGAVRTLTGAISSHDDSFVGNTASNSGGAIFGWLVPVQADGSEFDSNEASTGGAISSTAPSGTTTVTDSVFVHNVADYAGGAISVRTHSFTSQGNTFDGNQSTDRGGAVYFYGAPSTLTTVDDTFTDNHALTSHGGAVFVCGNLTVSGALFTDDTAYMRGGAIYSYWVYALVSITDSTFTNNSSATQHGGAIATKGDARVYDSTFSLNDAFNYGGAIYSMGATTLRDDTFVTNVSGNRGGAVYSWESIDDTGSTWVTNLAFSRGGAVGSHGPVTLTSSEFISNTASNGGAAYSGGTLHAHNAYFFDNGATASGGAVWANDSTYLSYSTFTQNEAADGGAIFTNDDTTTLTNVTMVGNVATGTGGALRTTTGDIDLRFSTLVGNVAPFGSAVGTDGPSSLTQVSFLASVVAGDSGALCDNLNPFPFHFPINATALSSHSFATDSSCGSGLNSINTTLSTMSSLGFDDTTLTLDDSTGQQVLIPNPTSVLVSAVSSPVAIAEGVASDQLLASRAARSDDAFTTIGAVQVRDLTVTGPNNITVNAGHTATFSVVAQPGVGTSLDYQWEQSTNAGASWSTMLGETTDTLTLPGVSAAYNGRRYRVMVSDVRGDPVASSAATLTVAGGPGPGPVPGPVVTSPPSAPREPIAIAGNATATVSWTRPASTGGAEITNYEVRNDVDSTVCQLFVGTQTPLQCIVTGLTNGRAYRFSVRALNSAGWSAWSDWTAMVTPEPTPATVMISIVGSRDQREVTVIGTTVGLVGQAVRPMVKLAGQSSYAPGKSHMVTDDGRFTWKRTTAKKVYVYFTHGDTVSNRVIIPALRR